MSRLVAELVIDTSALMALLLQEVEAEPLLAVADEASVVHLSAASRVELGLVPESSCHGLENNEVEQLLLTLGVQVVPFDQHHLHWALQGCRQEIPGFRGL